MAADLDAGSSGLQSSHGTMFPMKIQEGDLALAPDGSRAWGEEVHLRQGEDFDRDVQPKVKRPLELIIKGCSSALRGLSEILESSKSYFQSIRRDHLTTLQDQYHVLRIWREGLHIDNGLLDLILEKNRALHLNVLTSLVDVATLLSAAPVIVGFPHWSTYGTFILDLKIMRNRLLQLQQQSSNKAGIEHGDSSDSADLVEDDTDILRDDFDEELKTRIGYLVEIRPALERAISIYALELQALADQRAQEVIQLTDLKNILEKAGSLVDYWHLRYLETQDSRTARIHSMVYSDSFVARLRDGILHRTKPFVDATNAELELVEWIKNLDGSENRQVWYFGSNVFDQPDEGLLQGFGQFDDFQTLTDTSTGTVDSGYGSVISGQGSEPGPASNEKHKCPYCSSDFTRHHNLKSHLLTHSQEKPYVCKTCQARFRRLHDLKRHTTLHTGERPHTCDKCGRRFARGDALARHRKGSGGCTGHRSSLDEEDEDDGTADSDDLRLKWERNEARVPQHNLAVAAIAQLAGSREGHHDPSLVHGSRSPSPCSEWKGVHL